jgi:hypothetical protein
MSGCFLMTCQTLTMMNSWFLAVPAPEYMMVAGVNRTDCYKPTIKRLL